MNARKHPNYSASDYAALQAKGYTDAEIVEIWNRDRSRGHLAPLVRKQAPDLVGYLNGGR